MNYTKSFIGLGLVVTGLLSFSCANKPEKKSVSEGEALTYTNPLPVQFGDPYILLASDSMYYMYGTGGGAKDGFCAYSSPDLVNWKSEGQVFQGNIPGSWGVANFWAPEVPDWRGGSRQTYRSFQGVIGQTFV